MKRKTVEVCELEVVQVLNQHSWP